MANTFVHLGTATVGQEGATVLQFTSIPQNFTDLVVKISVRGMSYWTNETRIRFNNTSGGTSYNTRYLINGAGTASSSYFDNTSSHFFSYVTPGQSYIMSERTFGNHELYIPNYSGSKNKTFFIDAAGENGDTSYNVYAYSGFAAATWNSSAAITSIQIDASTAYSVPFRHNVFTRASLYGISKS